MNIRIINTRSKWLIFFYFFCLFFIFVSWLKEFPFSCVNFVWQIAWKCANGLMLITTSTIRAQRQCFYLTFTGLSSFQKPVKWFKHVSYFIFSLSLCLSLSLSVTFIHDDVLVNAGFNVNEIFSFNHSQKVNI